MAKSLTQIAFDFGTFEEPVQKPVVTPSVVAAEQPAIKEATAPVEVVQPSVKKQKNISVSGKRGRRSLKEIALSADMILVPEDEVLYKKQYYTIGEVANMFREKQSLIRYWETEFDILQPRKNRKGDRYFRPVDVKNLVMIYDLLRRRKFTIEGAKDYLKKNKKADEKFVLIQSLQKIKGFLLELKANL